MRDFSKISPSVWKSKKFRALPDDSARLVYLYLLTCPHGNSAGCFDLDPTYACTDLRISDKAYTKAIEAMCAVSLISYDHTENSIYLSNWATFNAPTNAKHAMGLISQLDRASSVRLKALALEDFKAVIHAKGFDSMEPLRKAIDSLTIAYNKGIATRPDQTEIETKTERETQVRLPPPPDPFAPAKILEFWNATAASHGLPKAEKITDGRRRLLSARIKDAGSPEAFLAAITRVAASSFCRGENDRGWKADFDFVLQQSSFTKIIEGKYDDKRSVINGLPVSAIDFKERMRLARKIAWDKEWGPAPFEPGCQVPPEFLTEEDNHPWPRYDPNK